MADSTWEGPATGAGDEPVRDIEAIIKASNFINHGTTMLGGSFADCTCAKTPCGGVAGGSEQPDCPIHSLRPAQTWHWAAECPGAGGR